MKNVDILIIGAGPAGCSASFFSKFYDQDNIYDIILLDKLTNEKYSIYHDMCGCCISQDAFNDLVPLKPTDVIEKVTQIKEYIEDNLILKTDIHGFIINRPQFQQNIISEFEKMGGTYQQGKLQDIKQKNGMVKIKTDVNIYKCKYLIAADGANSLIRKKCNFDDILKVLYQQFIIDSEPNHKTLEFFYDEKYNGDYKYIFPNGETTRIGFPYNLDTLEKIDSIIKKQSRFIGYGGMSTYVDGNVLLIGDAAGQTNILSKGGIRSGMYAGKLASKAVIKKKDVTYYEKKWKNSFFDDTITIDGFNQLKKMSNEELIEFYKPFKENVFVSTLKIMFSQQYKSYRTLYKAYNICDKYCW